MADLYHLIYPHLEKEFRFFKVGIKILKFKINSELISKEYIEYWVPLIYDKIKEHQLAIGFFYVYICIHFFILDTFCLSNEIFRR